MGKKKGKNEKGKKKGEREKKEKRVDKKVEAFVSSEFGALRAPFGFYSSDDCG